MNDHTGEFTGELIFEGRVVTRALGTSYDGRPESEEGLRHSALASPARVVDQWALTGDEADLDAPTSWRGVSAGLLRDALRATRDHIVERGFGELSLADIFARSELTAQQQKLIASHFPSADGLVCVLLRRVHTPLFGDLSEAAIGDGPVLERVRLITSRYVVRVRKDIAFYQRYTDMWSDVSPVQVGPEVHATLMAIDRQGVQVVAALLAEGQMRDEVRSGDPVLLARTLVACLYGALRTLGNQTRLMSAGLYADDLIDQVVEVLIAGLAASE